MTGEGRFPMVEVNLDSELLVRARALTGARSDRAVAEVALRRLIATKQKGLMIDGIASLSSLQAELGAPVVSF